MGRILSRLLLAVVALVASVEESPASSLRFHGNGVAAPDLDRVKIEIDEVGNSTPGPPADIGAGDFTIEFWMKAAAADNDAGPVACGDNIAWIEGNIVVDRDRFNQGRKFGLSIAGGKFVFGVSTDSAGRTVCGATDVLDGDWHHVAVTRVAGSGALAIWVDGALDGSSVGPVGDLSYPDDGVPCGNCCDGGNCNFSDPYLVLGAEKHDAGAAYPSYSGFLDELRLSSQVRYAAPFAPSLSPFDGDANTVGLYHFDEGSGDAIGDSSGHPDGPSDGVRRYGGTPAGPEWSSETPFGDPADLDGDGKPNTADECTVLVASQRFAKTTIDIKGFGSGAAGQSVSWKGEFRPTNGSAVDPAVDGVHVRIADSAGALLDVDIPAGLVGASPSTPCDARDGWTVSGSNSAPNFRYRNYSGFLDAGCSVSSSGIAQLKILDKTQASSPRVRFQLKTAASTIDVALPPLSLEASLALSARPAPGVASSAAEQGACGDHAWNPLTLVKPLPFCRFTPSPVAPTRLRCRTS